MRIVVILFLVAIVASLASALVFLFRDQGRDRTPVSYTHLRAHETVLDLVCRLLLEKKKHHIKDSLSIQLNPNQIHT